jgi:hypothetical protein
MTRRTPLLRLYALAFFTIAISAKSAMAGEPFRKIPLGFEENVGQAEADVMFIAHADGYTVKLRWNEAEFSGREGHPIKLALARANPYRR